jgi:hypothetical protein
MQQSRSALFDSPKTLTNDLLTNRALGELKEILERSGRRIACDQPKSPG